MIDGSEIVSRRMRRFAAALCACVCAGGVFADPAITVVGWQNVNGEYSGAFDDPAHWSAGVVPGTGDRVGDQASIEASGRAFTVSVTNDLATRANFAANLTSAAGSSLTLDGSKGVFRQVASDVENYSHESFSLRYAGAHFFNLQTYSDASQSDGKGGNVDFKAALTTISNGVARLSHPDDGSTDVQLDFLSGFYNWYDPDGTAYPLHWMHVCGNGFGNDVEITAHPESRLRFPQVRWVNNLLDGATLRLKFLGGEHEIVNSLNVPNYDGLNRANVLHVTITNGASLTVGGAANFGAVHTFDDGSTYAWRRKYIYDIADGGVWRFKNYVHNEYSAPSFFNVGAGGLLDSRGPGTYFGEAYATSTVTVARGGKVAAHNFNLGHAGPAYAHLVLDGGAAEIGNLYLSTADLKGDVDVAVEMKDGGLLVTTNFYASHGAVVLSAASTWTNCEYCTIGHANKGAANVRVEKGGTFYANGLRVGTGAKGTLDVVGGDVVFTNTAVIGEYATSTSVVNLAAGNFESCNVEYDQIALQVGTAGLGTLNVCGGTCSVFAVRAPMGTGYGVVNLSDGKIVSKDCFSIGYNGGGELNVSGGELVTQYFFLGQGGGANTDWATFRQTGGYVNCTCSGYRADVGIKLADANNRKTRVILDGGVLRTHRFLGQCSKRAGYSGFAALEANGGTVVTPFASADLIHDLDEAKFGPKGLTVVADYDCAISQELADKDDAQGEGLVVLAGAGVKTLTATNTTVAKIAAKAGTTKFAPDANGAQAALLGTSISVAGGATLSLVGDQTALDVKDLVLGDASGMAVLALDPGDVIRVSGSISIVSAFILVSDAYAAGADYGFIELAGDRSEELADVWAKLHVRGTAADRGYSFKVEYDEASGKTQVKLQVFEAGGDLGAATWTGAASSAWGTSANWQDGTAPDGASVAKFLSETAPNAVALGAARAVAGVEFGSARGYALSGGTLVVSALPGAKIAAAAGSNEIASATSFGHLTADAASGAELVFSGALQGDAFVKTGAGRMDISNGDGMLSAATLSNGTLAVSAPDALGGAATLLHAGRLLELGGAADAENVYPQAVTLEHPRGSVPAKEIDSNDKYPGTLAVKTPVDVTLNGGWVTKRGQPYKFGAGRLTIASAQTVTLGGNNWADEPGDWWYSTGGIALDGEGVPVAGSKLAGFNVAEGEVALVGTAAKATEVTFSSRVYVGVGVPQKGAAVPAALSLSHAVLDVQASTRHLMIGAGFTDSNASTSDVYLRVSDGAQVKADTVYVGRQTTRRDMHFHVDVDDAVLYSSYMMHGNAAAGAAEGLAEFTFRNGSRCCASAVNCAGRGKFLFDASTLASGLNAASPCDLTCTKNIVGSTYAGFDYTFQNGSTLRCNKIQTVASQEKVSRLAFDDATWLPCLADWTLTTEYPAKLVVEMVGKGVVFEPVAGETITIGLPFTGAGGLVKRGAGTLVFDGKETLAFTGAAQVEAGTLKVTEGAAAAGANVVVAKDAVVDLAGGTVANLAVSGEGTVANGTFTGVLPVAVDDAGTTTSALPVFDADTVAFGRVVVDFGRTAENPIPKPFVELVVGKYAGAAPKVSSWRVANTGWENCCGAFTAANGEIRVRLRIPGTTLIVR